HQPRHLENQGRGGRAIHALRQIEQRRETNAAHPHPDKGRVRLILGLESRRPPVRKTPTRGCARRTEARAPTHCFNSRTNKLAKSISPSGSRIHAALAGSFGSASVTPLPPTELPLRAITTSVLLKTSRRRFHCPGGFNGDSSNF